MEGIRPTARRLFSARLAVPLGILALALNIAGLVLVALAREPAEELIRLTGLLPTVAVGLLVAVRRPGNPLGWLLLGASLCFASNAGAVAYSIVDYRFHHGALPLGRVALSFQSTWAAGLVMVAGCLWLFPDGHLPAGRWRRPGGILFGAGLVYGALMFVPPVTAALSPTLRVAADGTPEAITHLVGIQVFWALVTNVGFFALLLSWLFWLAVQVPKYRRSSGVRLLQLKWLYGGAAIFVLCLGVTLFQPTDPTGAGRLVADVVAPGVAALPVALGFAIFKYRLYEIDRIISRTVSYVLVTGLIIGVYLGVVTLAIQVLRFPGQVGVAASTLIAAVLFNPLRKRVQRVVDRRFNRAHYDAEATVAAFAGRLRESVDLPSMENELAAAVHQAFEPAHVTVWLTGPAR
jgi:hypothetical protein